MLQPQVEVFLGFFGRTPVVDGDRLAVGSRTGIETFTRDGDGWAPEARLDSSLVDDAVLNFGWDIDLQGDRVVGSAQIGTSQYVPVFFERDPSGTWVGELVPSGLSPKFEAAQVAFGPGDAFAYGGSATEFGGGTVGVFERQASGDWTYSNAATSGSSFGDYGTIIDLQFVGEELFVGDEPSSGAGRVRTFTPGFSGYKQEQVLDAAINPLTAPDLSGFVGTDGTRVVLTIDQASERIAVVFEREPDGQWLASDELFLPPGFPLHSGVKPAVAEARIVIGNPDPAGAFSPAGRAHLFERTPSGGWAHRTDLTTLVPGEQSGFGHYLAFDGDELLAGATGVGLPSGQPFASGQLLRFEIAPLMRKGSTLSVSAGASQDLLLRPGFERAGETYLVLGSLAGTDPPTPIPGSSESLPLVLDSYTMLLAGTLGSSGSPVQPSLGQLDTEASAEAVLTIPGGLPPELAGTVVHHAFVSLDASGNVTLASNAVAVELAP